MCICILYETKIVVFICNTMNKLFYHYSGEREEKKFLPLSSSSTLSRNSSYKLLLKNNANCLSTTFSNSETTSTSSNNSSDCDSSDSDIYLNLMKDDTQSNVKVKYKGNVDVETYYKVHNFLSIVIINIVCSYMY